MPFSLGLSNSIASLIMSNSPIASFSDADRYVALHTADPTNACDQGELSGDGYSRVSTTFGLVDSVTGKMLRNNQIIVFPTGTGTKVLPITHFSIWNAVTGGTPIAYGVLSPEANWEIGVSLALAVNALAITVRNEI
jgi:hypothetical protein